MEKQSIHLSPFNLDIAIFHKKYITLQTYLKY